MGWLRLRGRCIASAGEGASTARLFGFRSALWARVEQGRPVEDAPVCDRLPWCGNCRDTVATIERAQREIRAVLAGRMT